MSGRRFFISEKWLAADVVSTVCGGPEVWLVAGSSMTCVLQESMYSMSGFLYLGRCVIYCNLLGRTGTGLLVV